MRRHHPLYVFVALCRLPSLVVATAMLSGNPVVGAESKVDFTKQIKPILSDRCFACHGPDKKAREGELRLDIRAEAIQEAIKPGESAKSELLGRLTTDDPEKRMPPVDSHVKPLSKQQVAFIKRWIDEGAEYAEHWSFIPPKRPALPKVGETSWPRNAIDHFVLARLQKERLRPSPQASKETLIRRVTLDLTGLPPTIPEIDAFLADQSPRAYEKVVNRLLASPRYGEHMARTWLDAARYADSHGYSLDRRRVMWPWRNWVINAFNDNMPFDRFTIEQLAGDLLPGATPVQQLATGFNRNHSIQSEGGVINEEYRVETVVDRVETTAGVFLGLTVGCARCHDHKYDPISQKEFYQLFAYFNYVPETAHVGNADRLADRPFINAPTRQQKIERLRLTRQVARLEQKENSDIEKPKAGVLVERVWIDDAIPAGSQSLGNGSGEQKFVFVSKPQYPVFSGNHSSVRTSKGLGQHLVHQAKLGLRIGAGAKLFAYVYLDPKNPPKQIMLQFLAGNWDHRAYWGSDHIAWGKSDSASRRRMGPLPKTGQWVRLEVDAAKVGLAPSTRITGWAFTQFDGTVYWDKAGVIDRAASPISQQLTDARDALAVLKKSIPTSMVMSEMEPPRKTFVLARGEYDQPTKTQVSPGLPNVLGTLPTGSPPNRLALAKWMVSSSNPLTARVIMNRYWQRIFGVGVVKTSEDFGSQGELPVHPELLDWLATEFVRSGWDVKAMQKLIVMSATYQQASKTTPQLLEVDPDNRLLARGSRFRLQAEMIRDQALFASGLLIERLGGESVRPYQPPGLWNDVVYSNVPRFKQDHGEKLYRRSMYTYWKRSVPPPNLQAFDAPSRETCVLKRSRTNTPLAALVLMNDPTFVEASRNLAERMITEGGDSPKTRLIFGFRLVAGRRPNAKELERLAEALDGLREEFSKDTDAAKKLMSVGESKFNTTLDVAELAAYTAVANALFSTDETITKN
jgi:hypothetical protein